MVFSWILRDSKPPAVSGTLLSIMANLNNVVVLMVFTRPPISKSSSPLIDTLVTVPSAPITFAITVTFMFHCCVFLKFFIKIKGLISLFDFFDFTLWSAEISKSTIQHVLFFFFRLKITGSDRLADIR